MPCGWKRTGELADALAHYRECNHPTCRQRLHEWDKLVAQFVEQHEQGRIIRRPSRICE
jgi:hypothetical protein